MTNHFLRATETQCADVNPREAVSELRRALVLRQPCCVPRLFSVFQHRPVR